MRITEVIGHLFRFKSDSVPRIVGQQPEVDRTAARRKSDSSPRIVGQCSDQIGQRSGANRTAFRGKPDSFFRTPGRVKEMGLEKTQLEGVTPEIVSENRRAQRQFYGTKT